MREQQMHTQQVDDSKIRAYFAAHLAFIMAAEGSREEAKAEGAREAVLASFGANEYCHALAITIGLKNVLMRHRDAEAPIAAVA